MSFEAKVLKVVDSVLMQDETATITHGVLFVPAIDKSMAQKILHALWYQLKLGTLHSMGVEYFEGVNGFHFTFA